MKKQKLYLFTLGVLCFTVSQILIRIPLLGLLNNIISFQKFQVLYPLLYGLFLSFSAGLFEESFRFLFRKFLVKKDTSINGAIIFGLGHGLIEVAYVFMMIFMSPYPNSDTNILIASYERVLAVIFHVGMTTVIWKGFSNNYKWRNLIMAIINHGLFNSIAVISNIMGLEFKIIYLILTLYCIFIIVYVKKQIDKEKERCE